MNKLLCAGFTRIKKSKIFWLLCGFMTVLGLYLPTSMYLQMQKYNYTLTIDQQFFSHSTFMGVLLAVFISLFIGTEYSDGTIRNKLIIGHSRVTIYISNLILCIAACFFITLSYMVPNACMGLLLLGSFQMGVKGTVILILCSLWISIAITTLFTMAAMLIHNKANLAVTVILAAFILLFFSSYLAASLSQPETQPNYIVGEDGSIKEGKPVPNEHYISGAQRQAYQFLLEFLPQGQCILLLEGSLPIARTFAYDTIIAVFATSIGIFGFQKKDIK